LGRKIGAVLAFVVGGAVAGASGIMLFAPETPGAFALAPLPAADDPAIPTVVAVAPAETAPAPSAADIKAMNVCLRGSASCEADAEAAPPATVLDDRNAAKVQTASAPVHGEAAKPANAPDSAKAPSIPSKDATEAALQADFTVSRPISSVAPQLATAFTAATIPAAFLASRQIASMPHTLVSPVLPALAARPKPVVTTAVALPVPAEPPAAEPAKPRKTVHRRNTRRTSNDYYRRQQNFFPFFFR
jgi:hypothetical protein